MILLDTSAIYALADRTDPNHQPAREKLRHGLAEGYLVHSYVLVESTALLQARLGLEVALTFLDDLDGFETVWVDGRLHRIAVSKLRSAANRALSLVDCVSFTLMEDRGLRKALAFDDDFLREGFELI